MKLPITLKYTADEIKNRKHVSSKKNRHRPNIKPTRETVNGETLELDKLGRSAPVYKLTFKNRNKYNS